MERVVQTLILRTMPSPRSFAAGLAYVRRGAPTLTRDKRTAVHGGSGRLSNERATSWAAPLLRQMAHGPSSGPSRRPARVEQARRTGRPRILKQGAAAVGYIRRATPRIRCVAAGTRPRVAHPRLTTGLRQYRVRHHAVV